MLSAYVTALDNNLIENADFMKQITARYRYRYRYRYTKWVIQHPASTDLPTHRL